MFGGVICGNRLAYRLRDRDPIDELAGFLRGFERIIGGEHHALVAERRNRAVERLGRAHARRRYHEVVLKILRWRLAELDRIKVRPGAAIEPPQQKWDGFAKVAEAEPAARKAVEQAAENQPQGVRSGLESPFPGGAPQALVAFKDRGGSHRVGRMQIDQRAKRFGALPERIERRIIEILTIGMAVDHGAAEFELAHATLKFVGRRARVLHGKMRKARIAVRPLFDLLRKK